MICVMPEVWILALAAQIQGRDRIAAKLLCNPVRIEVPVLGDYLCALFSSSVSLRPDRLACFGAPVAFRRYDVAQLNFSGSVSLQSTTLPWRICSEGRNGILVGSSYSAQKSRAVPHAILLACWLRSLDGCGNSTLNAKKRTAMIIPQLHAPGTAAPPLLTLELFRPSPRHDLIPHEARVLALLPPLVGQLRHEHLLRLQRLNQ